MAGLDYSSSNRLFDRLSEECHRYRSALRIIKGRLDAIANSPCAMGSYDTQCLEEARAIIAKVLED